MEKLVAVIWHQKNINERKRKEIISNNYEFRKILNDSSVEVEGFITFEATGKNYSERQESIRTLAENFFIMCQLDAQYNFTREGLQLVGNFFKAYGKQYGLTRELQSMEIFTGCCNQLK